MQHDSAAAKEPANLAGPAPIVVTLLDGKRLEFAGPVSGKEIAAAIGPGLAKAAIAFVLTVILSWGATAALRKIPGASHVL